MTEDQDPEQVRKLIAYELTEKKLKDKIEKM